MKRIFIIIVLILNANYCFGQVDSLKQQLVPFPENELVLFTKV
jgi:hypothetical protein